jgi:uncharacterized Fe-S cluster-containing radical SAM superfamily protein
MYDPLDLAGQIEKIVTNNNKRKYYRFRADRWYGGIATADCVGCILRCVFCWSRERDTPAKVGEFYSPEEVFDKLDHIAQKRGFRQLRISGNEPTLSRKHLLDVLKLVDAADYIFILETSGILLGAEERYARALSTFNNLRVRISLKGTCEEDFSRLTGAVPEAFQLQLNALKYCLDAGVAVHPAVMRSFSTQENYDRLLKRLGEINPVLPGMVEDEWVILYPVVKKRLKRAGIRTDISFNPRGVPEELV